MENGFVHIITKTDTLIRHTSQSFIQRRKDKAELESLAQLQAVEASLYKHKHNSDPEGDTSSNITRANTPKFKDFDLNEVTYQCFNGT
jgi:hypothetical protein